jgi:uncharacterized protein YdcH (DUF465 family)
MLSKINKYIDEIHRVQSKVQGQIDNVELTDSNEELMDIREAKIALLDEIIEAGENFTSLIEEYNAQWTGLKSIK